MINKIVQDILKGVEITKEQVTEVLIDENINSLTNAANKIRTVLCGSKIDLCSIINGKCGKCSENCKFCIQSNISQNTSFFKSYDLIDFNTYNKAIDKAKADGINHFSLVSSGRALNKDDYSRALALYSRASANHKSIKLCASNGLLTKEQLIGLKNAGISRYHANLETSERYFPYVCNTHTYADKIRVIKDAISVGLEVCSGGILGIGETMEDRIDMAFALRDMGIMSIPINIYIPLNGTAFGNTSPLSYEEILRVIAIFRFINPNAQIRLGAGRKYMNDNGLKAFMSGANAAITGDMLTTTGNKTADDIKMLAENGFKITGEITNE